MPSNTELKYVYTTDMVQCFPGRKVRGSGDRVPKNWEFENCKDWFLKELKIIAPKCLVIMGSQTIKAFWKYYYGKNLDTITPMFRIIFRDPIFGLNPQIFLLPHSSSMVKGKSAIFHDTFSMIDQALEA